MTEITMPCKHDSPKQVPGQPCPICGRVPGQEETPTSAPPAKPMPEEWKGDANSRPKNA